MMMRRGWFHESARHSLAARGVRTSYLMAKPKKKVFSVGSAMFRDEIRKSASVEIQDLTEDITTYRKIVKLAKAKNNLDLSKEDRDYLKDIRQKYQQKINVLKKERAEKNRSLNDFLNEEIDPSDPDAEQKWREKARERIDRLNLDRYNRAERMAREANVREEVKALGVSEEKSLLPGSPSEANITVAPTRKKISTKEARRKNVLISGDSGKRAPPVDPDFPTEVPTMGNPNAPFGRVPEGKGAVDGFILNPDPGVRKQGAVAELNMKFLSRDTGDSLYLTDLQAKARKKRGKSAKKVVDSSSPDILVTVSGDRPLITGPEVTRDNFEKVPFASRDVAGKILLEHRSKKQLLREMEDRGGV